MTLSEPPCEHARLGFMNGHLTKPKPLTIATTVPVGLLRGNAGGGTYINTGGRIGVGHPVRVFCRNPLPCNDLRVVFPNAKTMTPIRGIMAMHHPLPTIHNSFHAKHLRQFSQNSPCNEP